MNRRFRAFMSYTRFDDEQDRGYLSRFRDALSREVRGQTGEEFSIFHETKDITWGQHIEQQVIDSLQDVIFFIPILTPSFFTDNSCIEELQLFLERERTLQREDLILPVYYIQADIMEHAIQEAQNTRNGNNGAWLAKVLAQRQYVDWRNLRFEALDSQTVRKRLSTMAIQIRDVMREVIGRIRTVGWYEEKEIRKLLIKAFTGKELRNFGNRYFSMTNAGRHFTNDMTKVAMIQSLLDTCDARDALPLLVDYVQEEEPALFDGSSSLDFINRDAELEKASGIYSAPYLFFTAPSGYGKTDLLRAIEQRHLQANWVCVYTETPVGVQSAVALAHVVTNKAGCRDDVAFAPDDDVEDVANILVGYLLAQLQKPDVHGIILLIDSIERLPENDMHAFFNGFLAFMKSRLYKFKLRICLAGDYIGSIWSKHTNVREFGPTALPLFSLAHVEDVVLSLLPSHLEPDLYARETELYLFIAHVMHATGGHPDGIATVMNELETFLPSFQSPERYFTPEKVRSIIVPIAQRVRDSLDARLQPIFDVLSVFRRYNYRLLRRMLETGLLHYADGAEKLEEELMSTLLVIRNDGFIQDQSVRHVLATRLRFEEPDYFHTLCRHAITLYTQDLESPYSRRPELIAVEGLYQELRQGYYAGDGGVAARAMLRNDFLAEGGILHKYVKMLLSLPDAPDSKRNLQEFLLEKKDWEFRFAVNFFLREDTYSDKPYEALLQQIELFFSQS